MSQDRLNTAQVHADFVVGIEEAAASTHLSDVALMTTSDNASEKYPWMQEPPALTEFTGEHDIEDLPANEIEVHNTHYSGAFEVGGRHYKRDKTGSVTRRAQDLAVRAQSKQFHLTQDMINKGHTTDYGTAYDKNPYFSAVHELGKSGVQSNLVTASEVPALGVGNPLAPTPEEIPEILLGLVGHLKTFKDAAGELINENARRFGVLYKPTGGMMGGVVTGISANNLAGGATNPIQAAGYEFVPIEMARLDWTDKLAVCVLDGGTRPMIVQTEEGPDLDILDEDSEHYKNHHRVRMIANWIGGVGYGQYLQIVRGTLN